MGDPEPLLSLDDLLGPPAADPAPTNGAVAKGKKTKAKPAKKEETGRVQKDAAESGAPAPMRARDSILEVVAEWEFEELWIGLDRDDREALTKFLGRKRLAQIVQAGLVAERVMETRAGPRVVEDHDTRRAWARVMREIYQEERRNKEREAQREEREREKRAAQAGAAGGASAEDFFAGMRGRPDVCRKVIERLQAILAESEVDAARAQG